MCVRIKVRMHFVLYLEEGFGEAVYTAFDFYIGLPVEFDLLGL